ncbi:hypothetical protein AKJ09_02059 [Labilithrix luteola]|uniref:AB hydrolase-1 domain-containing protein n=2 Tax=Labilithrix luteola TaxID=1391654 RepID=A0A0K1PPC5_9BACT|nr:hypothetical protein AKJ09_02059 [Labilithrix luteola]
MDHAMETPPSARTDEPDEIARQARPTPRRRWRRAVLFVVGVLGILAIVFARDVSHHVRALELLLAFSNPAVKPVVDDAMTTFEVPAGGGLPARKVAARLYSPPGGSVDGAPAVVLVHGVHRLGIEEPRLQRFARSLAAAGIVVLTPQVDELADYHVAPSSIETVGASVNALRERTRHAQVGLVGTSFGGGIALLAAADPRFADGVSFVVAVGAHDDLERVSRFFVTDSIEQVSGPPKPLLAHEYGAMVLVYSHIEDFFPAEDVPAAREALRLWLWEKRDDAREEEKKLSPESRAKIDRLFATDVAAVRPELLAEIERQASRMKDVSPHGRLGGLRARTYLLHGEGDTVIPATETRWLAHDVPPSSLRDVLVSPAIVHVELEKPTMLDQLEIVHFMAHVIDEAEAEN